MAKTLFITYFIALTIYLISAYQQECAIGPQYWCKSFQNAQDCGAVRHCTDTVWRNDNQQKQIDSSTKCQWCEKLMQNTHIAIQNIANNEDSIKTTLINGCKMLPLEDISSKCMNMIENYATTVVLLMKEQRYDRLCQLMNICENENPQSDENLSDNDQSKILCNVIVQATHDLYAKQQKTKNEIEIFLRKDCQKLQNSQLIQKCEDILGQHGSEIYAHVSSNIELSKICDYIGSSSLETIQPVQCELCTVVLSNAKQMLTYQQTEDKVLIYIDEQICSRLTGSQKNSCKKTIDTNAKELIHNIKNGIQPLLLCSQFQVCLENIVDETSPIGQDEMNAFLQKNFCTKLGSLQSACEALIAKDSTRLLQILTNDLNGKDLCHILGLCPKTSLLLDGSNLKDDPSKCKRCVKDFTRRKHIAERLVNHSSEFLHHLCGQLPQQDDCIKSVDDSINELVTFIRSLDPRAICVQLNMCDSKNLQTTEVIELDNAVNEEIVEYIKSDICSKLGSLSSLCIKLADSEGLNLLNHVQKTIDPHQICTVLDVCPSNNVFKVCQDKCQCCSNKIEIYQRKLENFMRTIVASTRILCDNMPARDTCLQFADTFESNVNKVVARFDSKGPCQLLNLCPSEKSNNDQCQTCKTELDTRQTSFRITINALTTVLLNLCQQDKACLINIQALKEQTLDKITKLNSQTVCQHLGYCLSENAYETSSTVLRLKNLLQHQTKTLEQRLEAHDICSEYGQLKSLCQDFLVSKQSHRNVHVYLALLTNDKKLIDDDLREQLATKAGDNVCNACKNAIQSGKDFWDNSLNSVLNVLLRTCDYCKVKNECQDYYNRRFNDLKSYINSIDSTQFCQTLHLCSTSNIISPVESEESTELMANSNSTCVLCEYAMNILSNYIHQKSTEDQIEQNLEKVCQQMPSTLRKQCQEFIEDYSPAIIATLIRDFDVTTICQKLNLCTKQMKVDLAHLSKPNTASCSVCDYISTYLQMALKRDSSEKGLKQALSDACTHLSHEQKSQCQTLVQLFGTNIQQLQLGSGQNFCKQLPICQTPISELTAGINLEQKDEELKEILTKNIDDLPECTLCRYVVTYLETVFKNNQSEAAVEAALERICKIIPRKDRVQCNQFITNYGPVLAQLISKFAEPHLVCSYLGMCQAVVSSQDTHTTYSNHHYARIPV